MAQDSWVQIQARPSQEQAEISARDFSRTLDDVTGFALNTGWYAITLGPYSEFEAEQVLNGLRQRRLIPNDSFIAVGTDYRVQFWPNGQSAEITQNGIESQATPEPAAIPAQTETSDETVSQARASEAVLNAEERKLLQTALQWEGYYSSTIDGAFGRGTRASMAAYQEAKGYDQTGVLTTRQRARLIADYNAILEGLDLQTIQSQEAGLELKIPTAMVAFASFDPPFVHYDSTTGDRAQVLLISQSGDRSSLRSLYDVMQTLEIVPQEGQRRLRRDSFVLTGQNSRIHSHTQARLENGLIKGFSVVWPAGDDQRMDRLVKSMSASFAPFGDYALDENLGPDGTEQSIDLLAGLDIRKPLRTRSGVYISRDGMIVTSADAIDQCGSITLDDESPAELVMSDDSLGIAVLRPQSPLAPAGVARLMDGVAQLSSEIVVAGYSYGGILGAPSVSFGTLADIRGLNGEDFLQRLSIQTQPGDLGGPVISANGQVLGILTPAPDATSQLPAGVQFAARSDAVRRILLDNQLPSGIEISTDPEATLSAPQIMTLASEMIVLVSCWE